MGTRFVQHFDRWLAEWATSTDAKRLDMNVGSLFHPSCPVCRTTVETHRHMHDTALYGSLCGIARLHVELSDAMLADTRRYMHVQRAASETRACIDEWTRRRDAAGGCGEAFDAFDACQLEQAIALHAEQTATLRVMQPERESRCATALLDGLDAVPDPDTVATWDRLCAPLNFYTFLDARIHFLQMRITLHELAATIRAHMQMRTRLLRGLERIADVRRQRAKLRRLVRPTSDGRTREVVGTLVRGVASSQTRR